MTITLPQALITPSEALMATIGIKPVISRSVERVTLAQLREAQVINKKVTKLAKGVVNGDLDTEYSDGLDYETVLNDLAKGFQIRQVQQMLAAFPAKYRSLAAGFTMLASSLATELQKMYPISNYSTVSGFINQKPSDLAYWSFVNVLEVLNDPLQVFPLMASGALLRKEAQAVRLVYPSLSQAIDQALFRATASAQAEKKSFVELDANAEIGIKAWFGKAPIPPGLIHNMQVNHAVARQQQAQTSAPPPGPSTNTSFLSPSEKADNNPR